MHGIFPGRDDEDEPDPFIPTAAPVDEEDEALIPELEGRQPSHNEQVLIGGLPIHVGSSNVHSFWWAWREKRLFVQFLDGSLYSYEEVPLSVAVKFIESDSPGRFVWNVLRADGYAYSCLKKGTKANPKARVIRKH